jgi:hypothetical protein
MIDLVVKEPDFLSIQETSYHLPYKVTEAMTLKELTHFSDMILKSDSFHLFYRLFDFFDPKLKTSMTDVSFPFSDEGSVTTRAGYVVKIISHLLDQCPKEALQAITQNPEELKVLF